MKNKEQLLYFFLQGKISLSQYDYKFMANLQTMIQNQNRVTSNQATLFDNLISKYKKQLAKLGFIKEELKELPWKTMVVESTPEYTGATVSLIDDEICIRVPFNKTFISEFRNNIRNNTFEWRKESKAYYAPFSTTALKITTQALSKFFKTIRYDDELQNILNELKPYEGLYWNPTLTKVNDSLVVLGVNPVLGDLIKDMSLEVTPRLFFKLSQLQITIDPELYKDNEKLKFAANVTYETELVDVENVISWMRNIGCDNVIIGRGLRNVVNQENLAALIEKYGMRAIGPLQFGNIPNGNNVLMQHTHNTEFLNFSGSISKIVVLKDSRPIEVK